MKQQKRYRLQKGIIKRIKIDKVLNQEEVYMKKKMKRRNGRKKKMNMKKKGIKYYFFLFIRLLYINYKYK